MNEPGFHGLVSHGWMETAAQAVKCGVCRQTERETGMRMGRGNGKTGGFKTCILAISFTHPFHGLNYMF